MRGDIGRPIAATLALAGAGLIVVLTRFIQVDAYEQDIAMVSVTAVLLGAAVLVLLARVAGRARGFALLVGAMLYSFLLVFWLVYFTTMTWIFRVGLGAVLAALTAQSFLAWMRLDRGYGSAWGLGWRR